MIRHTTAATSPDPLGALAVGPHLIGIWGLIVGSLSIRFAYSASFTPRLRVWAMRAGVGALVAGAIGAVIDVALSG